MRAGLKAVSVAMLALSLISIGGCKKAAKGSPEWWVSKLSSNNWEEAVHALERLAGTPGTLGERTRKVAVPPLLKLFDRNSDPTVLNALVSMKDVRAMPAFVAALGKVDALSQSSLQNGLIAARALGQLGASAATMAEPDLVRLATLVTPLKTPSSSPGAATLNTVRLEAIRALAAFPSPTVRDALAGLLNASPSQVNILLQGEACLSLAAQPDVKEALEPLVRGLFLSHEINPVGSYPQCRQAIVRVGAAAVPVLQELLAENYAPIRTMAEQEKWKWQESGFMSVKAASLLGDLRATDASAAIREAAERELAKGEEKMRGEVFLELLHTLAILGGPENGAFLLKQALSSSFDDVRAHAANYYSLTGARDGVDKLLAIATDSGKDPNWRAAAAIAAGRIAFSAADKAAIEAASAKLSADDPNGPVLKQSIERAAVTVECGEKPDCYAGKLGDKNPVVAEKAILELGFLREKAAPVLAKVLETTRADSSILRGPALIAVTRIAPGACDACITDLTEAVRKLEGSRGGSDKLEEIRVVLAGYRGKAAAK